MPSKSELLITLHTMQKRTPPRTIAIRDLLVDSFLSEKEEKFSDDVLTILFDAYCQAVDDDAMRNKETVKCVKDNVAKALFIESVTKEYIKNNADKKLWEVPFDWPSWINPGQLVPTSFLEYLGSMVGYKLWLKSQIIDLE